MSKCLIFIYNPEGEIKELDKRPNYDHTTNVELKSQFSMWHGVKARPYSSEFPQKNGRALNQFLKKNNGELHL